MTIGVGASIPRGPALGVEAATPRERRQDQAQAMQDAAARTQENLPRAGEQLRDLPGALDRFAADEG